MPLLPNSVVLVSQNQRGELSIGDSHEYDETEEPFDKPEIDALILAELRRFLRWPELEIASRWHGFYVKHATQPWVVLRPEADCTVVTGLGGAGMTLCFGLAEQVVAETLGEA